MACFCSALATADSSTFTSVRFARSGESRSIRRASSTCRPRMRSTDRRSFRGEIRTYFALAFASKIASLLESGASLCVMAVHAEGSRRRELAQLVPHHRLGYEDRNVLAAVVDGDGVPQHLGNDRRPARPRLDDPLVAAAVHLDHLDHQVLVDERSFLDRTR